MSSENMKQKAPFKVWFQATRPFSFPASMIPSVLGIMLALLISPDSLKWYLIPFIILSLILMHASSNMMSDYDDYLNGVDLKESFGGSKVLTDELLSPKQVFKGSIVLYLVAVLFGLPIIFERGTVILLYGLFGILSGFFYTRRPISFKYIALGDLLFFFIYGPAIVTGTFYALTGEFNITAFYASAPVGMLVVGILHANNMRDIIHDSNAKIKTMSNVFGITFAKGEYLFLIIGAYLVVIVLILFKVLSPWSLLVFLSLPPAIKNMTSIRGVQVEDTSKIAMLDVQTAQLTLMFGILLSISVLLTKFL